VRSIQQQCTYCGRTGELTRDHIPPKNLFPKPRPSNLITVPCCETCNASFSRDDEHFRTIVACTEETAQHPEAQKLWEQRILSQLHRTGGSAPHELIKQSFGSDATNVTEFQIHEAEVRIAGVLVRIVKGLHFFEMGVSLPISCEVRFSLDTNLVDVGGPAGAISVFDAARGSRGRDIGDGVFSYRMAEWLGKPGGTIWLLVFFKSLAFLCSTAQETGNAPDKTIIAVMP